MIRVFVDTSIVRFADNERTQLVKEKQTVRWGPTTQEISVARPHTEYPLEQLNNEQAKKLYQDALRIPNIVALAKSGLLTLWWHMETHLEYLRNRPFPGPTVPELVSLIQQTSGPIYYGCQLTSPFSDEDQQLQFLKNLRHPGFEKWKKNVGVVAGSNNERNQLMDAWHVWSADYDHCDYFLTMDYRLIRSIASRKNDSPLRLVVPKQFLDEFELIRPAAELELRAWKQIRGTPN